MACSAYGNTVIASPGWRGLPLPRGQRRTGVVRCTGHATMLPARTQVPWTTDAADDQGARAVSHGGRATVGRRPHAPRPVLGGVGRDGRELPARAAVRLGGVAGPARPDVRYARSGPTARPRVRSATWRPCPPQRRARRTRPTSSVVSSGSKRISHRAITGCCGTRPRVCESDRAGPTTQPPHVTDPSGHWRRSGPRPRSPRLSVRPACEVSLPCPGPLVPLRLVAHRMVAY